MSLQIYKQRLVVLEKKMRLDPSGAFLVYYKDGETQIANSAECVDLVLKEGERIEHFEDTQPQGKRKACGLMESLLNGLLIPYQEEEQARKDGESDEE